MDIQTGLITAALIAGSSNDIHQIFPVAQAAYQNSKGTLNEVIADSGYDNNHQIHELKRRYGIHSVVGVQDPHRHVASEKKARPLRHTVPSLAVEEIHTVRESKTKPARTMPFLVTLAQITNDGDGSAERVGGF